MQIEVLLFGITRDIIGENTLSLAVSNGITVKKLKQQLASEYTDLSNYKYSVAINEAYAEDDTEIQDKDTIAFIPPVSGG